VKDTVAPLLSCIEPTAREPTTPPTVAVVGEQVNDTAAPPAVTTAFAVVRVLTAFFPAMETVQLVADALDVPVLVRLTVHVAGLAVTHDTTRAVTVAELVNDPNRPNTKPATAMAAMRVMAMRMIVARTGVIAFLWFVPYFL